MRYLLLVAASLLAAAVTGSPRALAEDPARPAVSVARLPSITVPARIRLRAELLEISRTRLSEKGFDFLTRDGVSLHDSSVASIAEKQKLAARSEGRPLNAPDAFLGFLDALRREQLCKSLGKHEITLIPGEPGKIRLGSDVATATILPGVIDPNATTFLGSSGEYKALPKNDGTIDLDLRVSVDKLYEEIKTTKGASVPAHMSHIEFATQMKLQPGERGVASQQLVQPEQFIYKSPYFPYRREVSAHDHELEVVLMVTVEMVEKSAN